MSRTYVDRLKADYRKTFATANGNHVLMDLYGHTCAKQTSFPPSGNPFELAFNEGKRWVWLRIMEQMRVEDPDIRKRLEQHLAERSREEGI